MGEVGSLVARGRTPSVKHREGQSTDAGHRGGPTRSSDEGSVMGLEPRGRADQGHAEANPQGEEPRDRPKPNCRAGLREPYDGRSSRTVLKRAGGGGSLPLLTTMIARIVMRTPELESK